jgi:hypothetical protein
MKKGFLFLILDGKLKDTVSKQKLGNTMPYIKVGMLTDFQLPVPPLAEQQRIVGLLDEAFEGLATAKANAEKNLQNARALFESHLQSVFTQRGQGWVESSIGETCEMYQPKTIGTKVSRRHRHFRRHHGFSATADYADESFSTAHTLSAILDRAKAARGEVSGLNSGNARTRPPVRAEARRAGGVEEVAAAPGLHR